MEANFRLWRQYDDDWNKEEAWPELEYPCANSRYLRRSGCFITALSIMLRRYGIEKEENPELFNPLILCKKLKEIDAYDKFADFLPEDLSRIYPIEYLGTFPFSMEKLENNIKNELPCLVMVPGKSGPYHYVVPDTLDDNGVRICDPGFDKEYLSEFEKVYYIVEFRKRTFCTENTVKYFCGHLDDMDNQIHNLDIPDETEITQSDVLVKAFEKWGTDMPQYLPGEYVAVLRNTVDKRLYLFKSLQGKEEMKYYICRSGKFLYGSDDYIQSTESYCSEECHSDICSLVAGECFIYGEK